MAQFAKETLTFALALRAPEESERHRFAAGMRVALTAFDFPNLELPMTLLLALVPALIAVYIFHATCSMRSPKAEARMREANKLGDRTPPPPNYGRVA